MSRLELGVAFMDFGIAVDSSGSVIEFSRPEELSDSCIWITDQDDNYVNAYLAGRARYKSDMYFGRRLKTIIADLGLKALSPKEQAQVLQVILAWALDKAPEYVGSIQRTSSKLVVYSRIENRQRQLKPILESASQRYCSLSPMDSKLPQFVMYRPASSFFDDLKHHSYPASDFRSKASNNKSATDLMDDDSDVAFVRIEDQKILSEINSLPYINIQNRIKDSGVWISTPEYRQIVSSMGKDLTIAESLAALSFTSIHESHPVFNRDSFNQEELKKHSLQQQISYSIFLIYEAVLGAHLGIGAKRMTLSEVYLSSLARTLMVPQVMAFQKAGFEVQGYGGGRIALLDQPLKHDQGRKKEFLELAFELGLMVPTVDFDIDLGDKSSSGFGTFFSFACAGDTHSITQLNHYILES